MLTREDILAARGKIKRETVTVPELGGAVIIQGMRGVDRDEFETSLFVGEGKDRKVDAKNLRARLCVKCIVNEQGERLFSDEDAAALGEIDASALDKMFDIAQKLCGMSPGDLEKKTKN